MVGVTARLLRTCCMLLPPTAKVFVFPYINPVRGMAQQCVSIEPYALSTCATLFLSAGRYGYPYFIQTLSTLDFCFKRESIVVHICFKKNRLYTLVCTYINFFKFNFFNFFASFFISRYLFLL